MKLPNQKKILREDLKGAPDWINPLIGTLNSFMETVYQALNHNITLQENVNSFVKEITYKTPSTYPTGVDTVTFISTLKTKPIGVQLLQVYDKATYTPPPGPVFIPWVEDNGNIVIYPITGLEADKTYLIRILVY